MSEKNGTKKEEKKGEKKGVTLNNRMRNGVKYTFTLSPADERQMFGKQNRWNKVYNIVYKDLFENTSGIQEFELYPDLSCPEQICICAGAKPRIHWHGTIIFSDIVQWMSETVWNTNHYRIEWDTITDNNHWEQYVKKFIVVYRQYEKYIFKYNANDKKTQEKLERQRKASENFGAWMNASDEDA